MRTPCTRSAVRRRGVLCALGVAAALVWAAGVARAEPVLTLVRGERPAGVGVFADDLARLWRNRNEPTAERLAVRVVSEPEGRLRAAARGRAHFAVVDAETAADRLPDYPGLTAVAVLWPSVLHAVTRNPGVEQVALPPPAEYWVLGDAAYAYRVLREGARSASARSLITQVPGDVLDEALTYAEEPVLLLSAPAPLSRLAAALAGDRRLRLLPYAEGVLDDVRLSYPWLITTTLERGVYPGMGGALEVPALHLILVGRKDLAADSVEKMLDALYTKTNAHRLFNPLFAHTDERLNAVFSKLFSFHAATARRFDFAQSLP